MPKQGITYEILIASPSDVVVERDIVSACAHDWNSAHSASGVHVRDVRWEMDAIPAIGERGQAVINYQLVDDADLLIGIFKARMGTPTGISASGTIEEIDRFIRADKPVMLYFSTGPIPNNHDPEQFKLLRNYKNQIASRGIYAEFVDENELRTKVSRNLAAMMVKLSTGRSATPAPRPPDLAHVYIRSRPGERSGDVRTVKVSAVIENISPVRRISNYMVELSVPKACLILAKSDRMIAWWTPPQRRQMFYQNSEGKVAKLNGHTFPQPPLVWRVDSGDLMIRALMENKRPQSATKLAVAPFWNLSDNGRVCTGSMRRPDGAAVSSIPDWERGFYESAFTHANVGRLTRHPEGFEGLWSGLAGKRQSFPLNTLLVLPLTLAQFVRGERR